MHRVLAALLSVPLLAVTAAFADAAAEAPSSVASRPALVYALPDFTVLVERNGPAVVNISTKQSLMYGPQEFGGEDGLPEDSPLYDFFQRFFGEDGTIPEDVDPGRSLGSGFIVSADGYVLTNSHVVEAADEIIVRTSDRREFIATIIGADERSDIALLKIEGADLPSVRIGSAGDLKVGEWVLAIGSPFGFEHSATAGIVSAKGRSLPTENYVPFIQTDVAINPGNSGGPLFNLDGEVVGVNSQIYSRTGGFMGLSFAIPIDVAMDVVQQLKEKGRVSRGWLGVLIQDVTRELAETFGLRHPRGALVAQVLPGSPAEAAGLRAGDIILSFNGKDIAISSNLPPQVGVAEVGSIARVQVLRDGEIIELPVLLAELPEDDAMMALSGQVERAAANRLGLVVMDLSDEEREELRVPEGGVLVDSVEDGPAQQVGIRSGDIIVSFDGQPVTDAKTFRGLLEAVKPGQSVAVLVQRGDGRMFYPIRIPAE
ncbi:DegQ family serine endoprotease [Thiohalocapsa marina]|uniref:Probable periplasmic serine endoprotease DegP-like n=1 Tax=Thiohalocapsa marina TaxID=424902 RepID=A0A5M8FPX9_9GAMM|nr:DegQ family serine endoprotease [Thiohalocapsa marina]KAA6185756.1 DegQ family serine endoprotease [Thiohalocapsa marina]